MQTLEPISPDLPGPAAATTPTRVVGPPYRVTRPRGPVDLMLDANEGRADFDDEALREAFAPARLSRYPDTLPLQRRLAARFGLTSDRVLVTTGADDAIDRLGRIALGPDRGLLSITPTFEMVNRAADRAGAPLEAVSWRGEFPETELCAALEDETGLVAVVSPNNPTGAVASTASLLRIADRAAERGAAMLVDLAYVEFADEDPTQPLLEHDHVVIVRTLSKAWGLAGLRIGYALGSPAIIESLRSVGGPFPVSGPALAIATDLLERGDPQVDRRVRRVRRERVELSRQCRALGLESSPGQGNFVLATGDRAPWLGQALAGLGIAVRSFRDRPVLERSVRITCPADAGDFRRLRDGIGAALAPQGLLFDLDGVLADVSRSYRAAIVRTAETFGVELTPTDVATAKRRGNANNDWELTRALLERRGVSATIEEVVRRFQSIYLGDGDRPGLIEKETAIVELECIDRLARRLPLGIVTGRPRAEAIAFLSRAGLLERFSVLVCMEDAPAKPDPAPVRLALSRLSIGAAWMIGDTVDDVRAARGAGVVPLGIVAPEDDATRTSDALLDAGAAVVLPRLDTLEQLLP